MEKSKINPSADGQKSKVACGEGHVACLGNWKLETGQWISAFVGMTTLVISIFYFPVSVRAAATPDPLDSRARVAVVAGHTTVVMGAPAGVPVPQSFHSADQIFTKVFNGSNALNVAVVTPGSPSTATGVDQVLNASFNGSNALNVICLSGCGGGGASLQVGGTAISGTSANFNNTTPAAQANFLNLTWQQDSGTPTTNISAEIPYAASGTYGVLKLGTACGSNNFVQSLAASGQSCAQPSFPNLSGSLAASQLPSGWNPVTNANLQNSSIPINGFTCTLGSACTVSGKVNTQTGNYTAQAADNGALVQMNCSSACTFTLPSTAPSTGWYSRVISTGSVTATVSLGTATFNGSSTTPVLAPFRDIDFYADSTGTNYVGRAPLAAGSNISITGASNALTVAFSGPAPTATALASTPTQCGANNFSTGIAASGNANCAQPTLGGVTATFSSPLSLSSNTLSVTGLAGGVLAGSGPSFTATPTLGVSGSTLGKLSLAGSTSGTATIQPQAAAGTPTLILPNTSGTFAVSGTAPVNVNSTTGAISLTAEGNGSKVQLTNAGTTISGDITTYDSNGNTQDSGLQPMPLIQASATNGWCVPYVGCGVMSGNFNPSSTPTGAGTANRVIGYEFELPQSITVGHIIWQVGSGTACSGGTLNQLDVAIWNQALTTELVHMGATSCSSLSQIHNVPVATSGTLQPGIVYQMLYTTDATNNPTITTFSIGAGSGIGTLMNQNETRFYYCATASSSASIPSSYSCGSRTAQNATAIFDAVLEP